MLAAPRFSWVASDNPDSRGGHRIKPGDGEQRDRQNGKAVAADALADRPPVKAAEQGEGREDSGSRPGGARDADGRGMGCDCCPYDSAKNARSVARTVCAAVPASNR